MGHHFLKESLLSMKKIFYFLLFNHFFIHSISIVHNFRIAEITKQPVREQDPHPCIIMNLLFDEYEKAYSNNIRNNFIGSFGSFIYNFKNNYFRFDAALAHIQHTVDEVQTYETTQTDDLLFTLGHNFIINNHGKIVTSILLGIPTHPIDALQPAAFGYGHISTGLQVDSSYNLNERSNLLLGARYFYFVPGIIHQDSCSYTFDKGNLIDLLIAIKTQHNHHGLQGGYTSRWNFRGYICPKGIKESEEINFHRNSWYAVYKYTFQTKRVHHRLLIDVSYGYDSIPKKYKCLTCPQSMPGYQRIITTWFSWSIYF